MTKNNYRLRHYKTIQAIFSMEDMYIILSLIYRFGNFGTLNNHHSFTASFYLGVYLGSWLFIKIISLLVPTI